MARLDLSRREVGSEFCGLERALLFDPGYEHIGWVHYLSQGRFELRGSRFTDIKRGTGRVYVAPPEVLAKVQEDDFVEVSPVRRAENVTIGGPPGHPTSFRSIEVRIAEEVRPAKLPAIAPVLPKDEFLYRASSGWSDADRDMLDWVIGLLLVSAPPSVYGKGGMGSEGLMTPRQKGQGTPLDVARTVEGNLPDDFLKGKGQYLFGALGTAGAIRSFKKAEARETNFSLVRPHRVTDSWIRERIPIQLPFVLDEARLTGRPEGMDLDVLDYQLCALYAPMPDQELVLDLVKGSVRNAVVREVFDMPRAMELDPFASVRVALSIMRLNIGREFKGRSYLRRPLSGHEEGLKVFERLLKRGMEEVERRSRSEDLFRKDRSLPFRDRLNDNDRDLYYRIRRIVEDEGVTEVPLSRLVPKKGRMAFEGSIANLNRYGYILLMKGGTAVRLVDLGSI